MSATKEQLQSTDLDIEQIRRLTHEYSWAIDNFQLEEIVELFVVDAVFDLRGFGAPAEARGHEEIRASFAGLIESLTACCHLTMNHIIDVDGDTARGTIYCHAFVIAPDGSRDDNLAIYEDSYIRTDEGWKFQYRSAKPLLPAAPAA
jgi:ketosteroid isomerase-like protein